MNLEQDKVNQAVEYVKDKGYNKFTYFDESVTETKEEPLNEGSKPEDTLIDKIYQMDLKEINKTLLDYDFEEKDPETEEEKEIYDALIQRKEFLETQDSPDEVIDEAFFADLKEPETNEERGKRAYMLSEILRSMNDEDAYYSALLIWPDGSDEEAAIGYFGEPEDFKEWEEAFERRYKEYHKSGLYKASPDVLQLAHTYDKKLGLDPIVDVANKKEELTECIDFDDVAFDKDFNDYLTNAYNGELVYCTDCGKQDQDGNIKLIGNIMDDTKVIPVTCLLVCTKSVNEELGTEEVSYKVTNDFDDSELEFKF